MSDSPLRRLVIPTIIAWMLLAPAFWLTEQGASLGLLGLLAAILPVAVLARRLPGDDWLPPQILAFFGALATMLALFLFAPGAVTSALLEHASPSRATATVTARRVQKFRRSDMPDRYFATYTFVDGSAQRHQAERPIYEGVYREHPIGSTLVVRFCPFLPFVSDVADSDLAKFNVTWLGRSLMLLLGALALTPLELARRALFSSLFAR